MTDWKDKYVKRITELYIYEGSKEGIGDIIQDIYDEGWEECLEEYDLNEKEMSPESGRIPWEDLD